MSDDLRTIEAALAEISEPDLHELIAATKPELTRPVPAPSLMAWVETACDWELNNRLGLVYPLLPPEAAIPPEEDAVSIDAAMVLRDQFAQDSPAARSFFDALVDLLTGGADRH